MNHHPNPTNTYFVAGGTLGIDVPSYVRREADTELLTLVQTGHFCYVLTTRQMGKSSLMTRTAHALRQVGVATVTIDLTGIGSERSNVEVDSWYLDLLQEIRHQLGLSMDEVALDEWWEVRGKRSIIPRFIGFLRDVALAEVESQVVIFVDEIDSTINLAFSDDFFAAIRAIYNARSREPIFERLTFVLFGVASPSDLIQDRTRTPFNIGQAVLLQDFNFEDTQPLRTGLENAYPSQGEAILTRIHHWTDGHPYLTQRLCKEIVDRHSSHWTDNEIDQLVESTFLSEEARKEPNLQFAQDKVLTHPRQRKILKLYGDVHAGELISDDEQSEIQNQLKLSGLVKVKDKQLQVRNRIYRQWFDLAWVKENSAINWLRIVATAAIVLVVVLSGLLAQSTWAESKKSDLVDQFHEPNRSATERMTTLVKLFELQAFVPPADYDYRAKELFHSLPTGEQQALFSGYEGGETELTIAVQKLYMTLADLEHDNRTQPVLDAMYHALRQVEQTEQTTMLQKEICHWVEGRRSFWQGLDAEAQRAYGEALTLNPKNTATLYERARLFARSGAYASALSDLNEMALLAQTDVTATPPTQSIVPFNTPDQIGRAIITFMRQELGVKEKLAEAEHSTYPYLQQMAGLPPPIVLAGTPIAQPLDTISNENSHQATELARWGKGRIAQVTYSPDGALLAVPTSIGIYLYDSQTLEEEHYIPTNSIVRSVAFSPDGQMLASGSNDGTIRLWGVSDRQLSATLEGHSDSVGSVAWSPDGERLASASWDNTVRLWTKEGQSLAILEGHSSSVMSVAWNPDGERLASASWDDTVRLWTKEGQSLATLEDHYDNVNSVTWSPDGERLASASWDNTVRLWTKEGQSLAILEGHSSFVMSVAWSPDGLRLASASWDNTVRLWTKEGQSLATLEGHSDSLFSVAWRPDGQRLASASSDNTVRLWSKEGQSLATLTLEGHSDDVLSVAWSPDGQRLASASSDDTLRLWTKEGQSLATLAGHSEGVNSVAWSPDGERLASASSDDTLRLWTKEGQSLATLEGHYRRVNSVAWSPDGERLASASFDDTLRLWTKEGQSFAVTFEDHSDSAFGVLSVAWSPDGQRLASASSDSTVRLWTKEGQSLATLTLEGDSQGVTSVAWSPDGERLASAYWDGTVRLWTKEGQSLATLEGHSEEMRSVAWSPDGERLASASDDGTVRLWTKEGQSLATLEGHSSSVRSLAWSPDGRLLASGSWDGTIRLWGVPP